MRKYEYKYKIDEDKRTVVALSTFAKKVVRGVAHCDPQDEFNVEAGKKLACARCTVRVAEKRLKRAEDCVTDAKQALDAAIKRYEAMRAYNVAATREYRDAVATLSKVEAEMCSIDVNLI